MNIQVWTKVAGVICIVCSSGIYGTISSNKIRNRLHAMEDCIYLFTTIKQQLIYTNGTPIDIFIGIRNLGDFANLDFIDSLLTQSHRNITFSEGWSRSVVGSKLPLTLEDKKIIVKLSDILGCYDIETQVKYIDLLIESLKQALERLRETTENDIKLTQTLSVLAGLFFAIIVI